MKRNGLTVLIIIALICTVFPLKALSIEDWADDENTVSEEEDQEGTALVLREADAGQDEAYVLGEAIESVQTFVSDDTPIPEPDIVPPEEIDPVEQIPGSDTDNASAGAPEPDTAQAAEETSEPEEMSDPEETTVTDGAAVPGPLDPARTLTISILGDSVSAYLEWSEGGAADWSNSTIRNNAVYYNCNEGKDIPVEDMWWYLAAESLGARILVNNAWSGGCVFSENEPWAGVGTEGWRSRCVQLHDDTGENAGEEPDIICVYLGINDTYFKWTTIGRASDIHFDTLIIQGGSGVSYAVPQNTAEAYAIMIDKLVRRYPNADIYCFTMLPHRPMSSASLAIMANMNGIIRTVAGHYGLFIVELGDIGVTTEESVFDYYMMDVLHPNSNGHKAIADAFLAAVRDHTPETPPTPTPTPTPTPEPDIMEAVRLLRSAVNSEAEPSQALPGAAGILREVSKRLPEREELRVDAMPGSEMARMEKAKNIRKALAASMFTRAIKTT